MLVNVMWSFVFGPFISTCWSAVPADGGLDDVSLLLSLSEDDKQGFVDMSPCSGKRKLQIYRSSTASPSISRTDKGADASQCLLSSSFQVSHYHIEFASSPRCPGAGAAPLLLFHACSITSKSLHFSLPTHSDVLPRSSFCKSRYSHVFMSMSDSTHLIQSTYPEIDCALHFASESLFQRLNVHKSTSNEIGKLPFDSRARL